jgi:DNA invertase Pin-like site-specific DNA recombinase
MTREDRCAIYARVSTRDQKPENQLLELRAFAAAQKFEISGEFVDHGESGAKVFDNPKSEHAKLCELARRGKFCPFGVVLVWKFDRFARSARELHNALFDFERAEIRFLSMREQLDTKSVAGRMMFAVLAGVAEMELGLTRERIFAGLARARAEGKQLGRPRALSIPQTEAAYEMRCRGNSWREIGRAFGVAKIVARESVLRFTEEHKRK